MAVATVIHGHWNFNVLLGIILVSFGNWCIVCVCSGFGNLGFILSESYPVLLSFVSPIFQH